PPASRWARPTARAPRISKRCASGTGRRSIARRSAISRINWWGVSSNAVIPRCAIAHRGCATWRRPGIHTHDGGYGFRAHRFAMPGNDELGIFTSHAFLLPRLRHFLNPARQHAPIGAGPKALQQVHEAGVVADQDARLVFLDARNDAQRRGGG